MPVSQRLRSAALVLSALVVAIPLVLIRGTAVSATPQTRATPKPKRSASPSPTRSESPSPSPSPSETRTPSPIDDVKKTVDEVTDKAEDTTGKKKKRDDGVWWDLRPKFDGAYSTDALDDLAARAAEFSDSAEVRNAVYAPFIIAGPSTFTDTWGSIRHGEGDSLRPHLGQDVFCDRQAPVLAAEPGRIEFGRDPLGGRVARLHHERGGYWYYAHLSGFAPDLSSGDDVGTGDVIGYCGSSGNAKGSSPHVHFGSYPGPRNPMRSLIGWLEDAEDQAADVVDRLIESGMQKRVALRLFGEKLVPEAPDEADVVTDEEAISEPLEFLLGLPL